MKKPSASASMAAKLQRYARSKVAVAVKRAPKSKVKRRSHVTLGPCKSKQLLVKRSRFSWLPPWINLYAERGSVHRCWEGHRLKKDRQDGRVHRECIFCEKKQDSGSSILACRICKWTLCTRCADERPRLPPLRDDPLFHGPTQPRLLPVSKLNAAGGNGTVIICPGGNYEFLVPQEGMPAAELLASHGIRAYVLRYRLLPKYDLQDMLDDLEAATALVRSTHGGPVAAMGFSAGGHLVASLSIQRQSKTKSRTAKQALDAQVLVYPCIDASDWAHEEWCGFSNWKECYPVAKETMLVGREALCGGDGFAAPPTLMVASTADEASPPKEHTDRYAKALRRHAIPYTYLRRDFGAHGFGLSGGWTKRCISWLQNRGFGSTAASLVVDGAEGGA